MPATWNLAMEGTHQVGLPLKLGDQLKRKYTGEPGLDDWGKSVQQQDAAVEDLRQLLIGRGSWNPNGSLDFYSLLRFIRARDYDLDRALNMVLDHLQWRQEEGVDHILDDFDFRERDEFLSVYPQGYHRTDRLGHPIYIQHLGSVDLARIREVTTDDRMTKYHIQEYERCLEHIFPIVSQLHGRQIDKTFAIVDAKGIGLKHVTKDVREILMKMFSIDQNNYPETLYHTCVINAPSAFRFIWAIVKPMLNARTQAKVEVCPKDYLPALKKWIDEESIPTYLGGKSTGTLVDDVGPWKDSSRILELNRERRNKPRRNMADSTIALDSPDLVQRQSSTLSIETEYEDALTTFELEDNPSLQKALDPHADASIPTMSGIPAGISGLPPIASKSMSLASRISKLEENYESQACRLQHYVPRISIPRTSPPRPCTLVERVEVLEQGMDLLLRLQEEQWKRDKPRETESRSCSCCCIM